MGNFVNFDRDTEVVASRAFVNATISTSTTTAGATVDTGAPGSAQQAKLVTIYLTAGTITDGSYALQVFEDTASGMGTETQVPAGRVFISKTPLTSTDSNTVVAVSVFHNKRYIRLKIVSTGVTTGAANVNAIAVAERM